MRRSRRHTLRQPCGGSRRPKKPAKACFDKKEIIIIIITGPRLLSTRRSCNNQSRSRAKNNKILSFGLPRTTDCVLLAKSSRMDCEIRMESTCVLIISSCLKEPQQNVQRLSFQFCFPSWRSLMIFPPVGKNVNTATRKSSKWVSQFWFHTKDNNNYMQAFRWMARLILSYSQTHL